MTGPTATIDGLTAPLTVAIERAVSLLGQARRVLITGLTDAPLEAIAAACDLAELLGAAVDAGADDIASPAGPILLRAGGMTADLAELRDRADLVIAWFCDSAAALATVGEAGAVAGGPRRRLVAVGPRPPTGWEHISLDAEAAIDAARLLHASLAGHEFPAGSAHAPLATGCRTLATAIGAATCVGILTQPGADPLGLAAWALARAVRCLAHAKPAFMVPLRLVPEGIVDNAAGAQTLLTWRYGAGGGIARADRTGGHFRPAECDAVRLIERGEVDAVLAVGRLPAATETAIADRASDLSLVRLDCRSDEPPRAAGSCVHVRWYRAAGTVLGQDGRERTIGDPAASIDSLAMILALLRSRLPEASA